MCILKSFHSHSGMHKLYKLQTVNRLFLIAIILFRGLNLLAAQVEPKSYRIQISGHLTDSITGKALAYATIALLNILTKAVVAGEVKLSTLLLG